MNSSIFLESCTIDNANLNLLVIGIGLKLSNFGILLGLDASLALVEGELGLALVGLVGGKVLLGAGAGILADGLVDGLVELLQAVGFDALLDVGREALLVLLVVLLLEVLHVLPDVAAEDALAVHVGVVLLGVAVVAREALLGVGDVESAVGCALEGAEDAAAGGGGLAADVEEGAEGALVLVDLIDVVGLLSLLAGDDLAVDLGVALVDVVEADLLEEAAGDEEACGVGGAVVLQADLEAVAGELLGVGLAQNAVAVDERVGDLADDLGVGEADDQAVLGALVLVLGLGNEALALTVVRAALAAAAELDLVPAEVRLGLLEFYESLRRRYEGDG